MNFNMVRYFLGWILRIEAVIMLIPCIIALIYQEQSGWYFLLVLVLCGGAGWACSRTKPQNTVFYAKEGFLSVALSWIVLSFFGSLPFYLSGEIPDFEDALFETISGFTTTGASILTNVEALPYCMNMWRCLTHWIGGMGVLVFMLAILPMAGGYNMHIMKAESTGPAVGKLVPRVKSTAKILYGIYLVMTIVQMIALLLAGMPWFDSIALSFSVAGTGGYAILNDSAASYTVLQQSLLTIFMIIFGINFNVYYLFLIKRPKEALGCEEARNYLGIIVVTVLLIAWNVRGYFPTIWEALHHSAFQVASIMTTTGFASVDFDLWPSFSKIVLIGLMMIGGCAGSTAGGMKVSRIVIAVKTVLKEMSSLVHPRSVHVLKFEGKIIEHHVIRSINTYIVGYLMVMIGSILLISLNNFDLVTTATAVASAFNNIGPGLGGVGPTGNFQAFNAFSKVVLMFDMLAGRLEIFPVLLLFSPKTWQK